MNQDDKPENINRMTQNMLSNLEKLSLLPEQINKKTLAQANLGFSYKELLSFEKAISRLDIAILYAGNLQHFCKLLKLNVSATENILSFFSFGHDSNYNYLQIELHVIFKYKNIFYLTRETTLQCITIFKHLICSDHFIGYYGISNTNGFVQAQGQITKFFSYKIADILEQQGYKLPRKCGAILVDLIIREKSLDHEINDVDVMALDSSRKIIYNIELKYYKPAIYIRDLFTDSFPEKHLKRILEREGALKRIKPYILNTYFNINDTEENYTVKSILVVSRPKHKEVYNKNKNIIMSHSEFVEKMLSGISDF